MAIELPIKLLFNKATSGTGDKSTGGGQAGGGNTSRLERTQNKTNSRLGGIGKLLGQIAGLLGVIAIVINLLKPLVDLANILVAIISVTIVSLFNKLVDNLSGFVNNIISFFQGELSLADLVRSYFESILGENTVQILVDVFTKIKDGLVLAWDLVKSAWRFISDGIVWVWDNIVKPAWDFLASVFVSIWDNIIKPSWDALAGFFKGIWNNIVKPVWEALADFFESIWKDFIKPAWDFVSEKIKGAWDILKSAFTFVKNKIIDFLSNLNPFSRGGGDGARAFGGVIPKDGLYRMHAGEQVSRGNTSNGNSMVSPVINISVSGGMDSKMIDRLTKELDRELQIYGRW